MKNILIGFGILLTLNLLLTAHAFKRIDEMEAKNKNFQKETVEILEKVTELQCKMAFDDIKRQPAF